MVYDVGFDNVNCATEDLAVTASGSLLYQPGCNADPIVIGSIDGQPLNAIFDPNGGGAALGIDNFQCLARDPSGGFYVVVRTGSEVAPQVLDHFDENVTEQGGYTEVLTMPALSQADAANPSSISSVAMSYCSLAVAPSNQIYLLSFERLWRLDPIGG